MYIFRRWHPVGFDAAPRYAAINTLAAISAASLARIAGDRPRQPRTSRIVLNHELKDMTMLTDVVKQGRAAVVNLPIRLHHSAYVVKDQRVTNAFYEGVLGFPMTQFWIEDTQFKGQQIVLSHAFYGLQDGSALCFFCMATPELHEQFKSPETQVFNHLALLVSEQAQDDIIARLNAAGYDNYTIEHGYCRSIYVTDPDGFRLEFTVDDARLAKIIDVQNRTAREIFTGWINGERRSNNDWRH